MRCKVRITKDIAGVWPQYRPQVGKIYFAEYIDNIYSYKKVNPICIIEMVGKRIIIRHDEFEVVGGVGR